MSTATGAAVGPSDRYYRQWKFWTALASVLLAVLALFVSMWSLRETQSQADSQQIQTKIQQAQAEQIEALENAKPSGGILTISGKDTTHGDVTVDRGCVRLTGYWYRIPADGDIWVVVRPQSDINYYPSRISFADVPTPEESQAATKYKTGSFAWRGFAVLGDEIGDGEHYRITLYYANSVVSNQLVNSPKVKGSQGISVLTPGLLQLYSFTAIRNKNVEDPTVNSCDLGKSG